MSQYATGASDYDAGANENPYAVWIRNVPTWLDEDRFYKEISKWYDVDKNNSYVFKNKYEASWKGVKYGWAIVSFKSKKSRNNFLDSEDWHFVKENDSSPYEKLKVSPWFDKPNKKPAKEKPTVKLPFYKSDLEKELKDPSNLTYEDFSRNSSDTSIHSFKGVIKSYITDTEGQGFVGDIEVKVTNSKSGTGSELVIFHSDSVWLCWTHSNCSGTSDCAVKCGKEKSLPGKLKPGAEVRFTSRRIPHGIVNGRRYQAKAVWLNQEAYPKFISPPPTSKLDEYLEDYLKESGQELKSKSSSPEPYNGKYSNQISTGVNSPSVSVPVRQKPLKGGLNQLNSNPSKNAPLPTQRKAPPTNFAQAVAPASLAVKDDQSNLILAVANVESILSETEALIFIPEYGNYTLHIKQIDFGFKPNQGINRYLTAKQSTVSVTLKKIKVGGKIKHDIVRAHLIDEKKALDEKFDPFFKDFKTKTFTNSNATNIINDNVEATVKNGGDNNNGECDNNDIDLDELDEYYDDLQRIIEYLERELPKVIPTIANEKGVVQKLSNQILSNPKNDEGAELQLFLDQQQIPSRIKHIFIAEFLKFRSQSDSEEGSPRSSPASYPQQDPEIETRLKAFFAWLKKREKKSDVFWAKLDLYSFVMRNFPVVANEWLKVLTNEAENHFQPFIKRNILGEEEFNKLKITITKYLKDNEKLVVQDFATLTTWLETDTNSYRSLVTKNDGFESGYLGLTLSKFEREFYDHQQSKAVQKTIIPTIRAILFLRYSEIKFVGLNQLHQRCPDDEQRSKDFIQKIQNLLFKWSNQRVLDDVNLYLSRETFGASDEDYPNMRLDKYVTVLSQALCDFFTDKMEQRKVNFEEKMNKRAAAVENEDKKKRAQEVNAFPTSKHFSQEDYLGFSHYLELSIASGRVTLAPTANVESIIWTFQARNVPFSKLADIYAKAQTMGGLSWQLQMSQLKLNPPLGVTVPEIAEYLASYFASVNNSASADVLEEETVEDTEVVEDEIEIVAEEDLLSMIQKSLVEQYRDPEVVSFVRDLKKGSIQVREGELIASYEEMFSGHQLFSKTCWSLGGDGGLCSPSVCALITAGIWHDLNVSSDFLAMCVRNIHDNQMAYQAVMIKWAKMLESSGVFSCSVLDIFTIIKATLLVYDESVPEQEFLNISTNYCLYNVEGYVASHLSESMFAVQTQFSLVICHLGVTYCQCNHDLTYPLPSDHWKQCSLESCVTIGTKVQLHSTGIKDPRGKIICQIADIVWSSDSGGRSDPPETGVLLPGGVNYKKYVQYFAEKMAARSTPNVFSDNNFTTNNARYLELDAVYGNHQEIFLMADTWSQKNIMEMRKEFVFCELGGMTSPLLRSNWAGALNTSDQEKERLLNETFDFFQNDQETSEMIDFIKPYVEKAGLRNAMKVLNQKYLEKEEEANNFNDTDSEKRKNMNSDDTVKEDGASSRQSGLGARNRQLSTDTIKDEALWLAENNLEQLWAEETEHEKSKRLEDLAEVNDDSEEYIEDDENPDKETKQLGAIGSSKPKTGRDSLSPHTAGDNNLETLGMLTPTRNSVEETLDKLAKFEVAMSAWQPMASDFISGNRDLIMQLSSRIEYLETALNQLTLNLASGGHVTNANTAVTVTEETAKNDVRKGTRTYVKIAKEGDEDDVAEVPTNSDGMLPELTVTALYGGTSAIKYKVAGGKTWRALLLENDVYHPPEDGWGDRVYTCTQPQVAKSPAKPDLGQETTVTTAPEQPAGHRPSLPASYTMPAAMPGANNNLVSPFLGMPPMAQIWGSGGLSSGLNLASQVSPAPGQPLGQSIFNNIGQLGNIGPGFSGPNIGPHFSKNN